MINKKTYMMESESHIMDQDLISSKKFNLMLTFPDRKGRKSDQGLKCFMK